MAHRSEIFRLDGRNALLSFLSQGAPEVTRRNLDARKEVDEHLRAVCHDYIRDAAKSLVTTMQSFLTVVDALPPAARKTLGAQSFASVEKVRDIVKENERRTGEELAKLSGFLHLYLDNKETEMILFRPIKVSVRWFWQTLVGKVLAHTHTHTHTHTYHPPHYHAHMHRAR